MSQPTHSSIRRAGYVDPNFPNPNGPQDVSIIIYGFTPSFALAVFAAVFFFLYLVVHTVQTVRFRSWWFITFSVGLVFEIVGYCARALSAKKDPYHLIYFVLNYFFIVTAPVFLAAGIYTILSVLIGRLGRRHAILAPKVILWFFIVSDVIATITQVAGAALIGKMESDRKDPTTANNILLGGLAYQVFSMGVYVIVTAVFLWRARHDLRRDGLTSFAWSFAAATVLIYLRTTFRLAETAEGLFGKLQTHEIYFACLEFAPVALAVLLVGCFHPGRCIKKGTTVEEDKLPHRTVSHV
ncbi:RTA1 like protein [Akanthomyces lecanii RCEF 1005]|uniref:RTA1 like protein n=1 Tax=Akanthomyces lecanii RCEF 1005 TaxID=1081108 RepID=A0A162KVS8_CORDF|nr:RTA1 like protein [Akanthomyces lecanii RCEF 1005]